VLYFLSTHQIVRDTQMTFKRITYKQNRYTKIANMPMAMKKWRQLFNIHPPLQCMQMFPLQPKF